jgi:hypothetical protein
MLTRQDNQQSIRLLLCTLLVCGCASTPEPLSPDLRQKLGKVYVNSAGSTGETFFHADFANGGTSGALKGAGKGALTGLDSCVNNAISSGVLGPVVLLVCAPIVLPGSIARGSAAGSNPAVPATVLAEEEQQTNKILQDADLSPALVATIDEQSQQNSYLAQYEISHGTLPAPEKNESIKDIAAKWGYQTVMEVQVTKAGLETDDGKVPMMHFSMTAQVKLVEAKTGSVLQKQDYSYNSQVQPYAIWFKNDYRNITDQIVEANKTLANNIIDGVFIK